ESYYEIAKELITSVLFLDGYKTLSHTDLIEYIKTKYMDKFEEDEIEILDTLRKRRNKIVYYGTLIEPGYIKRNKATFIAIINKLKKLVEEKLPSEEAP
ncbi:MAG: hypothetical protein ABIF10_07575, partial [Candidatus Woesearchaeota archaeon]